jgi:hypothetical protein
MLFGPRRDMIFLHSVNYFLLDPFMVGSVVNSKFHAKVPLYRVRELTILGARWEDKDKFIKTLMFFSGLKKLNLIEAHDGNMPGWFQNTENKGGVEFRRNLLEAFEERRTHDLGWSEGLPEINILPYQRVSKEIWKWSSEWIY